MPRITKEMEKRNALIRKDYEKINKEGMKKYFILNKLSEKYNLTAVAIQRIIGLKSNAKITLESLEK